MISKEELVNIQELHQQATHNELLPNNCEVDIPIISINFKKRVSDK